MKIWDTFLLSCGLVLSPNLIASGKAETSLEKNKTEPRIKRLGEIREEAPTYSQKKNPVIGNYDFVGDFSFTCTKQSTQKPLLHQTT